MKHWKLIIIAMTVITGSLSSQNAGNHNPEFSVSDVHIGGSDYVFIPPDVDATPFSTAVTMEYRNDDIPTDGSTALSWQSGDKIDVYEMGGTSALSMPTTWSDSDQGNKDLELEAQLDATEGNSQTLQATYTNTDGDSSPVGERDFTLVKLDLDIDADYDGTIDDDDEANEASAGGYVGLNQDDDDGDETEDKDQTGTVTGENDLEQIQLNLDPNLSEGTVELSATSGSSNIKIWEDSTKSTEVTLPKTWDLSSDTLPTSLYVEGVSESGSEGDVGLTLTYQGDDTLTVDDSIVLTVVKTDLDIDADYNSLIADVDDTIEVSDGGRVGLNQDDDDNDGTVDKDQTGAITGEDDLEEIQLNVDPSVSSGSVELDATAGSSNIKVWEDSTKTTEVTLPKTWDLAEDTLPSSLYVEGISASSSEGDVQLRLRYTSGNTEVDDIIALTVVEPDLDIDADYNSSIADADDSIEVSAGGRVGLNQDDDDSDGTVDKDQTGSVAGEDDLEEIQLSIPPSSSGSVELEATSGSSKIKVWEDSTKSTEVTLPKTWDLAEDALPTNLYVEGISASSSVGDVQLRLRYTSGNTEVDDIIALTVVKPDLDIDADYNSSISSSDDTIEVSAGGRVGLNQDDDDSDGTVDKDQAGAIAGEDDLEEIQLNVDPSVSSGSVKLEAISGSSKIKVWEDSTKTTEVTLPKTWDLAEDTLPTSLYVEGISASSSEGDVQLRLRYTSGNTEVDDTVTLTVVKTDLDIDADYNSSITSADDSIEVSAGGRVGLNQDDDDSDGTVDKDQTGAVTGEDDLEEVQLNIDPSVSSGSVKLEAISGSSKIKVWEDSTKTAEVTLPKTWDLAEDTLPSSLYVEGISVSSSEGDVELRLRYTSGNTEVDDMVKLTVVKTDLDIDADYNGSITDADDSIEMSAGGLAILNQDDDDSDGTPDKDQTGSVTGEDDLEEIELSLDPTVSSGTLKLEAVAGGSKIKIWENSTKGTEVTLPKTWTIGTDAVPTSLYVEGVAASSSERDVELRLRYTSGETEADDTIALTLLKVDIEEVYETDQVWNKIPNPRRPAYDNADEVPEDELYNRLFVAIEPDSSKIEITAQLKDRMEDSIVEKFLAGVRDQATGNLVNEFAAFSNPANASLGSVSELSFTPGGSGEDIVYEVVLGLDTDNDGALAQSEILELGGTPFTLSALTPSDIDDALNSPEIVVGSSFSFIGQFVRYFLADDNSIGDAQVSGSINHPIGDKAITMISGSDYDQSSGSTDVINFHSDSSSSHAEVLTNFFSEDASRGLYQLVQRTWERHATEIWNHFETTSDTEKLFTYLINEQDTQLNFYYESNNGVNAPRLMFGGAKASGGTVSLSLYKDGNRIYANLIGLNTTVLDLYDFDFTKAANTASREGAIIQTSYDAGRNQGRIFHIGVDVTFIFTDQTDNGSFPQPIEFFNENSYIEDGVAIGAGDAGTGSE